jgi:hypothetical protein
MSCISQQGKGAGQRLHPGDVRSPWVTLAHAQCEPTGLSTPSPAPRPGLRGRGAGQSSLGSEAMRALKVAVFVVGALAFMALLWLASLGGVRG